MEKTEIVLNDDVLAAKDAVSTTFFIKHGDICFPDDQWTDLTSSILEMWGAKLKNLSSGTEKFFFMDGPYRLDVFKDGENLKIDCVYFRNGDKTEHSFECLYSDFLEAFRKVVKEFQYMLYTHNLHTGEYEPVYAQMQILLQEYKNL